MKRNFNFNGALPLGGCRRLVTLPLACLALLVGAFAGNVAAQAPPTGAGSEELSPANPVRKWVESRRILVEVGSGTDHSRLQYRFGRHFGHRIGDIVPVELRIYLLPTSRAEAREVQLDFEALLSGSLSLELRSDPDFEMVRLPGLDGKPGPWAQISRKQEQVSLKAGETTTVDVYTVAMLVRTFRPQQAMPLTIELAYALEKRPDGKTWDWKPLSCPAFVITRSPTADNGTDLLSGDTSLQEQEALLLPYPLIFFGGTLLSLPLAFLTLRLLRWLIPPKVLDPEEIAWADLDLVFAEGKKSGFTQTHFRRVLVAIKRYARVETLTAAEVDSRQGEFFDGARLVALLNLLEVDVLYKGVVASSVDTVQLRSDIEKLIPRP